MTNLNFIEDILSKSIISRSEIIGDVLFVDSNPAKIEIVNTKKVNDKVEKTTESVTYTLEQSNIQTDKITDSGLIWGISLMLDKEFIKSISKWGGLDEVEFYAPFLLRPFVKNNINNVIEEFYGENWIITNNKVLSHLKKHNEFQELSDDKATSIKLKGRIRNTTIFTNEDVEKNVIWKGNNHNCSAVMLNDISIDFKDNIYDIKVDYLFNSKGIRKLTLI